MSPASARTPSARSRAAADEVDVVIVGAGAVGCLAAAVLAQAGKRVLVLEAGPAWGLGDLASSQIWSRRLKWGGPPVRSDGAAAFGHGMAVGWGLGGSALHHYANWPRLRPEDFRMKSLHDRGADWPIDYETLRPFYDRIQAEVGISGDAEAEVWRAPGAPYPHPAFPPTTQAETLARGFAAKGLRTAPAPLAILSEARPGRSACVLDGWCDAGCPTGALANPLVTYHPAAVKHGAVFRTDAPVSRILMAGPRRASGVVYLDGGRPRTVTARAVVLAASAIQTPRLLLASATPEAPQGLGNAGGLVGRRFMCHALVNVMGVFPDDQQNWAGWTGGSLVSRDGWGKTPAPGAFGSHEWVLGAAMKPNDLIGVAMTRPDLYGPRLDAFLKDDGKRIAAMGALCETLPDDENRVTLGEGADAFGSAPARVTHRLGPETLALLDHARREGSGIVEAAGAREVWTSPVVTNHALGGTPMGRSAADSVTDSFGRLWDAPNLFVWGGGLFPTIGAGGPTFTLHALTLRAAEHLVQEWSALAA